MIPRVACCLALLLPASCDSAADDTGGADASPAAPDARDGDAPDAAVTVPDAAVTAPDAASAPSIDAGQDARPPPPMTGDSYGGGIVYHVDATGEHGLIAAPTDASSTRLPWGCSGVVVGASSTSDGASNQAAILASSCTNADAAEACDAYVAGGYTDWYLPSREELSTMVPHVTLLSIEELDFHWSSTELDAVKVGSQDFVTPSVRQNSKPFSLRVRCIRKY